MQATIPSPDHPDAAGPVLSVPKGLSAAEIPGLRKQFGPNVPSANAGHPLLLAVWNIVKEPMFLMLLVACGLYFVLGAVEEGLLMLTAMILVAAISFYQEVRSSKALVQLRQLTAAHTTVIRDGKEQVIPAEELLPGDLIKLAEGNRVPADARILQSNDLSVNESALTGESFPVDKHAGDEAAGLLQGATINSGSCMGIVTATGNQTMLGKLGKSISQTPQTKTRLQQYISRFVKIMAVFGLLAFLFIWLLNYQRSGNLLQGLLQGLVLAMSAVPEEIPVAFTSFMALGAYRMSRLGIITRQPIIIENLGAVNVICLDKTGTITENRMALQLLYDYPSGQLEKLDPAQPVQHRNLLYDARLASEEEPFDAMEQAIDQAAKQAGLSREPELVLVHEYPLGGKLPMMTHVYGDGQRLLATAKGSPERIVGACKLNAEETARMKTLVASLAAKGYRMLGVCSAEWKDREHFPKEQDEFDWHLDGFIALYDPPKKEIASILSDWYKAGISVKLITGDYAETALNIAGQVGLKTGDLNQNGTELEAMTAEELAVAVKKTTIFSRMFPEAKLRVIEALKQNGSIVAMVGDGINDAPALKSAHIGIALGSRGTEMAREAADLVLTDNNLKQITEAIRHGRTIYNNLKKAVRYIISIHIPIIFTAALPLILGWKYPNIFTPIHVIFLELVMGPTCSIFFEREPEESGLMQQPPRPGSGNMFSMKELGISITQGLVLAAGVLALYYYSMQAGKSLPYVRAMVFMTLLLSNGLLTFVNRSFVETIFRTIRYRNSLAPYVILASLVFIAGISFLPFIRNLFQLATLSLRDFLNCLLVSLVCTLWFELYKAIRKKYSSGGLPPSQP